MEFVVMVMVEFTDILIENTLLFKELCVFETRYFREKFGGQSMRVKRDLFLSIFISCHHINVSSHHINCLENSWGGIG